MTVTHQQVAFAAGVAPTEDPNLVVRGLDQVVGRFLVPMAQAVAPMRRPAGPVHRDMECRVRAVETIAESVVGVSFVRIGGEPFPQWFPGAHIDVVVPADTGPMMRHYSLVGNPADQHVYQIAVRLVPASHGGRGGSARMHRLVVGDNVTVKGPRQAFTLIDTESYLFVAGGIGITAIWPMVRTVARAQGRDWRLVYTGRTRGSMPFIDQIHDLVGQIGADQDRVLIWPDDEVGQPDATRILEAAPPGSALYACGPPPMIDAIRSGLPDPRIETLHYERFSPPPVQNGEPFTVRLKRSGTVVEVGAHESALDALLRVNPDQPYSCRQGFCGTCVLRVVAGDVEHRDSCMTPAQRTERVAVCVSRSRGEMVVDL